MRTRAPARNTASQKIESVAEDDVFDALAFGSTDVRR